LHDIVPASRLRDAGFSLDNSAMTGHKPAVLNSRLFERPSMIRGARLLSAMALLATTTAHGAEFKTLQLFQRAGDAPGGALAYDGADTMYGTITNGQSPNFGAVFKLTLSSGIVATEYGFTNGAEGADPEGTISLVNGIIYGTSTILTNGIGTGDVIFAIDAASGTASGLYNFSAAQDGAFAMGVTSAKSALYGTTSLGGTPGFGVVYKFDPATGKQTILHAFTGGGDGAQPGPAVLVNGNTLLGTTYYGGGTCNCGTIFAINTVTGAKTILWRFRSGSAIGNGGSGNAVTGLVVAHGILYGTIGGVSEDVVGVADATAKAGDAGSVFKLDLRVRLIIIFSNLFKLLRYLGSYGG
jgi:uncharacterized repeat protein (TIGR03803 family)